MPLGKDIVINWFLVILLLFPNLGFANCKDSVQALEKGQPAPCTGLLYSEEADKKAAQDHEDAKFYKDLNLRLEQRKELTDKEINVLDKRLKLYIDQSETLAERLHKRESQTKWEKALWFGFGVLATGIAVYGASRLNN